ncbi:MAG: transporter substrate-binding domain-containing protein, partial [Myxococcales bacterium]|nr:transporter substrate-binding domain-containing protein [Myxococcales bacterium]
MRVGTSADYAPFSQPGSGPADPTGFDVEIARAYARDAGATLSLERFRWPALLDDLERGAFDVAMSGVTLRPERSIRGRFGVPVASSGALVLTDPARAAGGLAGLDRPEIRIAVNQGGHLERVARAHFPRARLLPQPENDAVRRALAEARVDAVVTDTLEAPHWQRSLPGTVRLGPFTRDRKAHL